MIYIPAYLNRIIVPSRRRSCLERTAGHPSSCTCLVYLSDVRASPSKSASRWIAVEILRAVNMIEQQAAFGSRRQSSEAAFNPVEGESDLKGGNSYKKAIALTSPPLSSSQPPASSSILLDQYLPPSIQPNNYQFLSHADHRQHPRHCNYRRCSCNPHMQRRTARVELESRQAASLCSPLDTPQCCSTDVLGVADLACTSGTYYLCILLD